MTLIDELMGGGGAGSNDDDDDDDDDDDFCFPVFCLVMSVVKEDGIFGDILQNFRTKMTAKLQENQT